MSEYQNLDSVLPLTQGEIYAIGQACGNGWRKVFNVYAKLLYALDNRSFIHRDNAPTWQQYRDEYLLQSNSQTALRFSSPRLCPSEKTVHIICGKTYAKHLLHSEKLAVQLTWLDDEFAINNRHKLIVCPYFDYRQLSNIKIEKLALLLQALID